VLASTKELLFWMFPKRTVSYRHYGFQQVEEYSHMGGLFGSRNRGIDPVEVEAAAAKRRKQEQEERVAADQAARERVRLSGGRGLAGNIKSRPGSSILDTPGGGSLL
jgi:hypothetical protein